MRIDTGDLSAVPPSWITRLIEGWGESKSCTKGEEDSMKGWWGRGHHFERGTLNKRLLAKKRLLCRLDDYEYEFSVLTMRIRIESESFSKCVCSERKTRIRSRPRLPI